ncbi:MAG: tetratricopeptide repeat protein [Chlorobi bacterium]|nr:tetratricopeptide repeat protein [Chlorobiota bacterium]
MNRVFSILFVCFVLFFTISAQADNPDATKDKFNDYVQKAMILEGEFNYPQAILTYDSAIELAKTEGNRLWLAHLLRMKARSYTISNTFDSARVYAEKARYEAVQINNDTIRGMALLNLGSIFRKEGELDSARVYYTQALELMQNARDTLGMAKVFQAFSILYKFTGDYDKGLESALKCNYLFEKYGKSENYIRSLIDLANIYEKLNDYDTALACYDLSYRLSIKNNLPKVATTSLSNKGVIYFRLKKYDLSESEFEKAIAFNDSIHDSAELARLHNNISILYLFSDNEKKLKYHLNQSLKIAGSLNLPMEKMRALNTFGSYYRRKKNYDKALQYYQKTLKLARQLGTLNGIASAAYNVSLVYENMEKYKKALEYYRLSTAYSDSVFNETKQKEIEKHKTNYEILHLKDLNRIKELDKKRIRAQRNATMWVSVFIVTILLGLLIFFRMRSRKNRIIAEQRIQKLEDEKKLMAAQSVMVGQEKERERIARELHDGIGVLLSTASIHFSSVEDKTDKETGEMLKKANKLLKEASKEVRQISHNMMPGVLSRFGLKEAVEDLFENVKDAGEVKVDLRLDLGEQRLSENMEIMLFRVIQEMLNNTLKHAKASKITFSLRKEEDRIKMEYADNGIGFDEDKLPNEKRLGLSGIRSRVEYLGGKIKLESRPGEGTKYFIVIPLEINET